MKKATVVSLSIITAILILAAPHVVAEGPSARTSDAQGSPAGVQEVTPGTHTRVVGTLQYDNDTPFRRLTNTDDLVGNRFAGVANPHSIASVSFRLAQNYGSSVVMSIWDVNSGSAVRLRQSMVAGLPNSTVTGFLATFALASPIVGHSGPFIAGIHNTFYTGYGCPSNANLNGTCDGVALTGGSPVEGVQLFHGAYINLSGGAFTPATTAVMSSGQSIPTNAIFRVTGDNLPVELMSFSAE